MAEEKGKHKFDDDLKEGLHKSEEEVKEAGGILKKDFSELDDKVKGNPKK